MYETLRIASAAALVAAASVAHAGVLFDSTAFTSINDGTSPRQANMGVGQTLAFTAGPQAIGSFGFLLTANADTTFKFLIFLGKDQKLFEINRTATTALDHTLFLSPEFSFVIPDINQYTFAVVADKAFSFDYDTQSPPLTQNGITEIQGQNANYIGFANPLFDRNGLAEIKMVLNSPALPVPEAATWALFGLGLMAVAGAVSGNVRKRA
ncbi:MAG: PEP-CTERM sorting domain-containing protein [Rubrivivax sp.]